MLLALTGATGFIGQHLLRDLPKRGYRVRALLRRPASLPTQTASAVIGDLPTAPTALEQRQADRREAQERRCDVRITTDRVGLAST